MIEMQSQNRGIKNPRWVQLHLSDWPRKEAPSVSMYHYRINGVEYTDRTDDFIKAWDREVAWFVLRKSK